MIPRKPSATDVLTWVIGSGGLIGRAIASASPHAFEADSIPWNDDGQAIHVLTQSLAAFLDVAQGQPWSIVWAAGAGTTVSGDEQFAREVHVFEKFIAALATSDHLDHGVFVLISSAGGIHAGSPNPPFDAATPPAPISPYGNAKLKQEDVSREELGNLLPLLVCRVSNAYGPGQDLGKQQGLISRLALCTYKKEPLHLFVPTSTVRDYVFTRDIAAQVHAWITHVSDTQPKPQTVIVASGQGTSIAQLVKIAGDVSHRRIPIAMGSHPSARNQPLDSRFMPTPIPGADFLRSTPLPVGVKAVFDDVVERLAQATS